MARATSVFVCQKCGEDWPKWSGRCPSCGEWNSLVETAVSTTSSKGSKSRKSSTGSKPIKLSEVKAGEGYQQRMATGMGELDRVLGGGIVAGSAVLVAGEPGIGKSTLLTQLALQSTSEVKSSNTSEVLYVCGEESPEQVKLRIERLATSQERLGENLLLLAETDVDEVIGQIGQIRPIGLIIVDSVQTLSTQDLAGMAGSVGQVRECAGRLIEVIKGLGIPLFLVGHVTKEGAIAGPKVLEHMVDVVLSVEGEREHDFRIVRGLKNRFGATDEVGVFAMSEAGMREVTNPSDVFLEVRQLAEQGVPGSAVVATVTGLRPMLIEVQALVVPTQLAIPRRVSTGVDQRKVQLLVAVLQKRCGLALGTSDVFVNVAGGLTVNDPGADLGVALAIASSFLDKPLPSKSVVVGEVGLLGEIRPVRRLRQRVEEAKKLGYGYVVGPDQFKTLRAALEVFHKK